MELFSFFAGISETIVWLKALYIYCRPKHILPQNSSNRNAVKNLGVQAVHNLQAGLTMQEIMVVRTLFLLKWPGLQGIY